MQTSRPVTRAVTFDFRMRGFLGRLHRRIASRCFVSGAFVLEVPPSSRFQQFVQELKRHSSKRMIARTHDDFQNPGKLAAHRVCARRCAKNARTLQWGQQYEYRFSPPLHGLCGPADASPKGVLLWYTFTLGQKPYVYMKLETHSSTSPGHTVAALKRYVLKQSKKTPFETRREDAYKNSASAVAQRAAAAAARNVAALWPEQAGAAKAYDQSVRVGMELFVPATVVASLM